MKILHVLDHSLPLHSGYTFRSQNIFSSQKGMGFDPVILTSPKHEESWKKNSPDCEEINGFRYYRTGRSNSMSIPGSGEINLIRKLEKRILQVCEHEKPDLIHAHSPVLNAFPAIRAARKLGLPVFYEIRAFWEDAAVDHGTYKENSWKYKLTKALETWVCKKVDQVITICNGLKNDLIERGIHSGKISVVFNGVNPDDFRPVPADSDFRDTWNLKGKQIIGFLGSFYRYEGLDLLVEAFSKVAAKHPDSILLLVGGGEMEKELREQVATLQLGHQVVMTGRIPHEKVPGVYALVDLLAYPRYSMRLTELVTPLKPLEAMAMGKALVASDVGGHRELIQDKKTGMLFSAGDSKALAAAMENVLSDSILNSSLETQGQVWVKNHHTWEKTTALYPDLYSSFYKSGTSSSQ